MKFPVGNIILFWNLLRETSFNEIEELAEQNPRLGRVGDEDVQQRLQQLLGLTEADRAFTGDESSDVVLSLQRGFGRNVSVLVKNSNGAAEAVQLTDEDVEANRLALGKAIF